MRTCRKHVAARLAAGLAGLALLGGTLAGCRSDDGTAAQQQSQQPAAVAAKPAATQAPATLQHPAKDGAATPQVAEPPRGAPGAVAMLQRLQENDSINGAADAAAVAGGSPPVTVSARLATQALDQPNPTLRREAVATVALQRSDDATDLLLTTADDPAPAVRRQSVESLWISAKDMPGRLTEIEAALQRATSDSSPAVAQLAQRALADIDRQKHQDHSFPPPDLTTVPPPLPGQPQPPR